MSGFTASGQLTLLLTCKNNELLSRSYLQPSAENHLAPAFKYNAEVLLLKLHPYISIHIVLFTPHLIDSFSHFAGLDFRYKYVLNDQQIERETFIY